MAKNEHLTILKKGPLAWNQWRKGTSEIPDLSRADLSLADLGAANLSDADMMGVELRGANLIDTKFNGADLSCADARDAKLVNAKLFNSDLSDADFSNADLSDAGLGLADLSRTHLRDADLSGADFELANFSGTNLKGAKFQCSIVGYTRFADCDLSGAKGLDLIQHKGPSTIGVDTIYRSKGKIPESFLRGCGVPESFIAQMHSLVSSEVGIQFYSCFISYSGVDDEFARRLHGRMRDAHLRVWFAPEDIQGGKKLHEQIETAIRVYDKLLIVLSEASLKSEWVMDELRKGFKAERDTGKRKLFPVLLTDYETLQRWECRDSLSGKDLAEEVRQYFIPDFSNWKDHDQFEEAFSRLLKDLRAEERAK